MKTPPVAQGTRKVASGWPVNSLTRKVPLTAAIGRHTPRTPETRPRCTRGTWSGRTATKAASNALKDSCAMHHPTRTTGMLGANATITMPRVPPTRPMTSHGRRMPSRDEVRSLILPKKGLPNIATRAPIPATSAKLLGARSIPTRELTLSGKVTRIGAWKTRLVLMNANVYSDMNPQPTLCAPGDSSASAASAAISYFNPPTAASSIRCHPGCHLRARVEPELVQDVADVSSDRTIGNEQAGGDLLVAQSVGDEPRDLQLALPEGGALGAIRSGDLGLIGFAEREAQCRHAAQAAARLKFRLELRRPQRSL